MCFGWSGSTRVRYRSSQNGGEFPSGNKLMKSNALADQYPLSIVIPCYNAARTLGPCLEALLANDLTNVEVTVVDDASTDGTKSVLDRFGDSFVSGLKGVRLPSRSGPGAARNAGTKHSDHPYLFFLDADILLPHQSVKWIRETLDLYSHRKEVAGTLGTYAEEIPEGSFLTQFKNLYTCYLYKATDTFSPFIHTPIFVVKRDVLVQNGGFDEDQSRAEDFKLGISLGSRGFRFIIDWRIKGAHLKQYSLRGLLVEDWRRIFDLRKIKLTEEERRFSYRAHRWNRILSLALPAPILILGLLGILNTGFFWLAGALLTLFWALNYGFLAFCIRQRGLWFGLKAAFFLLGEMLWAQTATLASLTRSS